MSDQIPKDRDGEIPPTERGVLPTPAERAQHDEVERQRRQDNDHQLLLSLQQKQANAQVLQAKTNVVIACLTGALVVVSLIGGFVSFLQFQAANTSAGAANSAAQTASKALEQSKIDNIAQDERARKVMDASAAQAKAALDASIMASRTDQRAWLGVKDIILARPLKVGEEVMIGLNMFNSGKTPALDAMVSEVGVGSTEEKAVIKHRDNPDTSAVSPGTNTVFYFSFATTDDTIRDLIADKIKIYVRGTVAYRDIFGLPHPTTFCAFYPTPLKTANLFNCSGGSVMQ